MTFGPHVEQLGPHFTKFFIAPNKAIHHFSAPDTGDFHDHPFDIEVRVLEGKYMEEVMRPGFTQPIRLTHYKGSFFVIRANHIHRTIDLFDGPCTTYATYGPWQRKSRFWRFGEKVERRDYDQTEWEQIS